MEYEELPLADSQDNEIIMHRNAHFGGKFDLMLDYYSQDGIGVQPDFTLDRIEELYKLENELKEDLTDQILSDTEKEQVEASKQIYQQLREVYSAKSAIAKGISALVLTEEEVPEDEIEALAEQGEKASPFLHDLISSEHFYDPLFPGYSFAPIHAAKTLAKIGSKTSIPILFERIGRGDFINEEAVIDALKTFGEPAKTFLQDILKSRPIRQDTERAAIALLEFEEHQEGAKIALKLLQEPDIKSHHSLMAYLIFACDGLEDQESREAFKALDLPKEFDMDRDVVIRNWS